ncbi:DctP family TRAP transporter solute-binding subunit [Jiangella anatolica]|uniref:DctP family TRAP transporter solute-binding subunit n=1 Tax=Jiangella anatolica TaxID=2670374 RepID=UPI0018F2E877|nr:DctP family TRAP transporter solute-binding subunit [Jiangella anatolica]
MAALILAGCGGDDSGDATEAAGEDGTSGNEPVELVFSDSYSPEHAHNACGADLMKEELASNDSGIDLQIFPSSQLGPDGPERVSSVAAGDIDIDIQGSSAISSLYEPIGALDAAYVFDGPDHLFEFADSPAFDDMAADMLEKTGIRALGVWFFGMRHFTANQPIRTPDDLEGLRMRYPDSPQFLQNAEAVGANATPVAFEEVYLALQQGVIDGQENPIPTIVDMSFSEVQSHVSLSGHQTGFVVAIMSEDAWQSLSPEQQEALQASFDAARDTTRQCLEDTEQEILDGWNETGEVTVVDDVDREAFSAKAEAYFAENLQGDKLALYQQIRELAQ